ncbi:MAG TPA: hypothetical protein VL137_05375 [Polyangiaceae bacterium]|nr:hypothetical protein [Polyangiaceae bacterium]
MASRSLLARRFARCSTVLALVVHCGSALAAPKLQGIGEAALGYTDNVQTAPQTSLPGDTTRTSAALLMLSPGVLLAWQSARVIQRIGYQYEHDFFFAEAASNSSANRLEYQGFFDLSPRVALVLGAGITESNRYASLNMLPPGVAEVSALPVGAQTFLQGNADETLYFDVARNWRAWQGGNVLYETPIFKTQAPQTSGVGARTGLERLFRRDAVGSEARANYTVVRDAIGVDGLPRETQQQLVFTAVGTWRHDWSTLFASSAEAGALRVQRFNTGRGAWYPTGTASLFYTQRVGDAQLSYTHTVTTNALLGQSLLVDEIRLRGGVPLTRRGDVVLASNLAFQYGRLIDENAELAARVNVLQGDVLLGWQATEILQLGVRYQHIEQISDATTAPLPLSFVQNSALVGATIKLPPDRDMPRAYRAARRVDGQDEIRDAAQPDSQLEPIGD